MTKADKGIPPEGEVYSYSEIKSALECSEASHKLLERNLRCIGIDPDAVRRLGDLAWEDHDKSRWSGLRKFAYETGMGWK